MAPPESQLAENLTEVSVLPERPPYLRPVPDTGFLEDENAQPIPIRERFANLCRGVVDRVLESGKRSDAFWDHMWIEKAVTSSVIGGGDPEVARMRAIQAVYSQKKLIKNS